MNTENAQKSTKIALTNKKIEIFYRKISKNGGKSRVLRAPLRNVADVRVCAWGARKFDVFKLKMPSESKTNGGRYLSYYNASENIWDARASVRHAWLRPWLKVQDKIVKDNPHVSYRVK